MIHQRILIRFEIIAIFLDQNSLAKWKIFQIINKQRHWITFPINFFISIIKLQSQNFLFFVTFISFNTKIYKQNKLNKQFHEKQNRKKDAKMPIINSHWNGIKQKFTETLKLLMRQRKRNDWPSIEDCENRKVLWRII